MDDLNILRSIDEKLGALIALVAYQVEHASDPERNERVEIILNNAGLPPTKVANLLGKKPNTVIKTIKRNK
jgi:hypothetical protein